MVLRGLSGRLFRRNLGAVAGNRTRLFRPQGGVLPTVGDRVMVAFASMCALFPGHTPGHARGRGGYRPRHLLSSASESGLNGHIEANANWCHRPTLQAPGGAGVVLRCWPEIGCSARLDLPGDGANGKARAGRASETPSPSRVARGALMGVSARCLVSDVRWVGICRPCLSSTGAIITPLGLLSNGPASRAPPRRWGSL